MNSLAPAVSRAVVENLGWMLLHSVWQFALVAGALAVTLRLMAGRSPQARYNAACIALVAVVLLPLLTLAAIARGAAIPELAKYISVPETPDEGIAGIGGALGGSSASASHGFDPHADDFAGAETSPASQMLAMLTAPAFQVLLRGLIFVDGNLAWIVGVWWGGVMLLSLRQLGGWVFVRRLASDEAFSAPAEIVDALNRLVTRMRLERVVTLLQSTRVHVPSVIGFSRPVIMLPAALVTGLTPDQIEAILAHELAHIRRYDYFVNLLQTVVETLFFYHPGIWWLSSRLREEREHCADDDAVSVLDNRLIYARALASLEERCARLPQPALAATGSPLLERIERLLGVGDRRVRERRSWPAGLVALCLITLAAVLMPLDALRNAESALAAQTKETASALVDSNGRVLPDGAVQRLGTPPERPRDGLANESAPAAVRHASAEREQILVAALVPHGNSIGDVAISPDGQHAYLASFGGVVSQWNIASGSRLAMWKVGEREVGSLVVSDDSRYLAAAIAIGGRGGAAVVDTQTGRIPLTISSLPWSRVQACAFSRDANLMAVAGSRMDSTTGEAQVWNLVTRRLIATFPLTESPVKGVCFSADGRALHVVDEEEISVWKLATRQKLATSRSAAHPNEHVAFTPDRTLVVTCGDERATVRDLESRTVLESFSIPGTPDWRRIDVSADGSYLAIVDAAAVTPVASGFQVWNLDTGRQIQSTPAGDGVATSIAFTPDGLELMTGTSSGTALVWAVNRQANKQIVKP